MKKVADLKDMLQRAGSTVGSGLGTASSSLKDWYGNINPDAKQAILSALIGAGIGGAATGGMAAATPHDPDEKRPVMGPALLGALLGGTAAAGLPYGMKLLTGKTHFPGLHDRKPFGASAQDTALYPVSRHPFATVGLGAGMAGIFGGKDIKGGVGTNAAQAAELLRRSGFDPKKLKQLALKEKILAFVKAYPRAAGKSLNPLAKTRGGKYALLGVPAGLAGGALVDKLVQGEY